MSSNVKNRQIQKRLWVYYISGIIGWVIIFIVLFGSFSLRAPYVFSHIFCIVVLSINFVLQIIEAYVPGAYDTEEKVYEYVERNTYYLIMAITIFLLISTNSSGIFYQYGLNFKLIVYSQASAIAICIAIIALYWMPTKSGKEHWLVHLRHIKTVLLTYALSLFFIGPVEVILKIRTSF